MVTKTKNTWFQLIQSIIQGNPGINHPRVRQWCVINDGVQDKYNFFTHAGLKR